MKMINKIEIPKPCENQVWSSEYISEKEKLCLLCSKKVFDATSLDDKELFELVNSKNKPKCMKFKVSQLNRNLNFYNFNIKPISDFIFVALVSSFIISCSAPKQLEKNLTDFNYVFETDLFFKDSLQYVIRGVVVDLDSKEPIPNAFISIKGWVKGVKTNENGFFKFDIPQYILHDSMILKIRATHKKNYDGEFEILKSNLPLNQTFEVYEDLFNEVLLGLYRTID